MSETVSSYTHKPQNKKQVPEQNVKDKVCVTKDFNQMMIDHTKMHNNPSLFGKNPNFSRIINKTIAALGRKNSNFED